jgi:hypothetical protein
MQNMINIQNTSKPVKKLTELKVGLYTMTLMQSLTSVAYSHVKFGIIELTVGCDDSSEYYSNKWK